MSDTSLTQFEPRAARILVVDDEPANLKLLSLMLRTEGYQHDASPTSATIFIE